MHIKIGDHVHSKIPHTWKGIEWNHTTGFVVDIEADILTVKCEHGFEGDHITYEKINKKDVVDVMQLYQIKHEKRIKDAIEFYESIEDGYDNPKG